ncbi:hypothetical protein M011DRAFT_460400 [Sporormia fimetaria CBS 119925]|uniref:Uncharacterized protein n=1 Tax=Sporormia fimetaria CBS 119925 TaxID=1340428 RepID=A0A6A6V338_9PLEO|nr:hypothetical protein M011DRAFT_460400 [Sporormia fimetaria CBS 119925]
MKTALIITLIAPPTSIASARLFVVFEHNNFNWDRDGGFWVENRVDSNCWDIGEHGRKTSSISVGGDPGCTTFYNQRGCIGGQWVFTSSAGTVPAFLNDNILVV